MFIIFVAKRLRKTWQEVLKSHSSTFSVISDNCLEGKSLKSAESSFNVEELQNEHCRLKICALWIRRKM